MWQIVCLSACVQASIWLCEQLILLSQLDWSRQGSEYAAIRTTSSARDPTVELMKCPSRGGGRESCKGQWHFPSRGDVRGSKSGFCLRVCVCLFFQSRSGQRGERRHKSMAWPSLRASQTLSTVTTVSVGNNAVGAREDYLNCGKVFFLFFLFLNKHTTLSNTFKVRCHEQSWNH